MSNLIIGLLGLVLVSLIAYASMFYLGDSVSDKGVEGKALKLINEGQQINSALKLYSVAEGNEFYEDFNLKVLEGRYLTEVPQDWVTADGGVIHPLSNENVDSEHICYKANEILGFDFSSSEDDVSPYSGDTEKGIPFCSKEGLSTDVPCCYGSI